MTDNTPVPLRKAQQLLPRIVEVVSNPNTYVRIADDRGHEAVIISADVHTRLREIAAKVEDEARFHAELSNRAADNGSRSRTVADVELNKLGFANAR